MDNVCDMFKDILKIFSKKRDKMNWGGAQSGDYDQCFVGKVVARPFQGHLNHLPNPSISWDKNLRFLSQDSRLRSGYL